jgi:hypothetical protein
MITADEESSKVVITIPTNKLLNELEVYFLIQILALSPSAAFSVSDKFVTAKRNKTNPAIIDRMIAENNIPTQKAIDFLKAEINLYF